MFARSRCGQGPPGPQIAGQSLSKPAGLAASKSSPLYGALVDSHLQQESLAFGGQECQGGGGKKDRILDVCE